MPVYRKKDPKWLPFTVDHSTSSNDNAPTVSGTEDKAKENLETPEQHAQQYKEENAPKADSSDQTTGQKKSEGTSPSKPDAYERDPNNAGTEDEAEEDRGGGGDDDDDIGDEYEDGDIERNHVGRVVGKKLEYHRRGNTSRQNRR